MLKGDMCLKIMEKDEPKDVHIREGEVSSLLGFPISDQARLHYYSYQEFF